MPTEPIDIPIRTKGAKAAARDIKRLGSESSTASTGVKKLGGALAAVAGVAAIGGFLKGAVKLSAEMEVLSVRLKVLTGNAGGAQDVLQGINDLATETPFALNELGNTAASLAVIFKKDTEAVSEFTGIAADLAAAFGKPVEQIGENLQRAFSAGLGSADVLREAGITAEILRITGASQAAELSQQDLADALRTLAAEGGIAFNAAAEAAQTLDGSISNTGIAISNFQRAIGDVASPLIVAVLNEAIIPAFGDLEGSILDNRDAIAKLVVEGFGSFVSGSAIVINKIADLAEGLEGMGLKASHLELAWVVVQAAFQAMIVGVQQGLANAQFSLSAFVTGVSAVANALGILSDESFADQMKDFEEAKRDLADSAFKSEAKLIELKDKIAKAAANVITDEDTNAISTRLRQLAADTEAIGATVVKTANELIAKRAKQEKEKGESEETVLSGEVRGSGKKEAAAKLKAEKAAKKAAEAAAKLAAEAGEKFQEAFSGAFEAILSGDGAKFADSLSTLLGDSVSKKLSEAFQSAGLGEGLSGALGGAVVGVGADLLGKALSGGFKDKITTTSAGASAHVDNLTQQATRGVVVGPQSIAIAQVGNAIQDASIETNAILRRIADNTEPRDGRSGGSGANDDSDEFIVSTQSASLG